MNEIFENLKDYKPLSPHNEWIRVYDNITLHTRQRKLKQFISKQRPNEPDTVLAYRQDQSYRQTREAFEKATTAIIRALNDLSLKVDVSDASSDYLAANKFSNGKQLVSLNQYLIGLTPRMIEDPNALLIWMPFNDTDNFVGFEPLEHPLNVPDNQVVGFKPVIKPHDHIYVCTVDFAVWHGGYTTLIKNNTEVREKYFLGADKTAFYRYWPIGYDKHGKVIYQTELYYEHNLGINPFKPLGGYESYADRKDHENDLIYYESFFASGAEWGKDFIASYSDFKANFIQNSYPIREVRPIDCPECSTGKGGSRGQIYNEESDTWNACHRCDGKGHIPALIDPYAVSVKPKKRNNDESPDQPLIEFYSDGTDTLQFQEQYCWKLLDRVAESININYIRQAQSGVAKQEDKESYYNMLEMIIDNFIMTYVFSLQCIEGYLNINESQRVQPEVKSLKSVKFNTEKHLNDQVITYSSNNVTPSLRTQSNLELIRKQGDPVEIRINEILSEVDPLYAYSPAEILQITAQAQSPITQEHLTVHNFGYTTLKAMAAEMGNDFLTADKRALVTQLNNSLQITDESSDDIEDVLDEKIDIEAEAKAKLKGTVGGVQGIIGISQAVARGEMTERAGEKLIEKLYGFSAQEAKELIDKPNGIRPDSI